MTNFIFLWTHSHATPRHTASNLYIETVGADENHENAATSSVHWSVKRRGEPSARSSHQRCSVKKVFLSILQNSQENACARACLWIKLLALGLQKETCKIYKNTYFYRTPLDDCFSSADKVLPFMRQALAKMNSLPQVINTLQKENWRWDICWTNIYHAWRYTNILWKAKLNDFPGWN